MTITELRDRLTAIIEENKTRGWEERNESDMVISIKTSKRIHEYRRVKFASSGWVGLRTDERFFEITADDYPIWRNGNEKRS